MTLLLFVILIALATLCAFLKRRRAQRILLVVSVSWFLAVGCGAVPAWLLNNLQSDYGVKPAVSWGERNVIVLLGAGTEQAPAAIEPGVFAFPRLVEATALYHQCHQAGGDCTVLVSGGDARHQGAAEATVYQATLLALGIPPAELQVEDQSMNTWQNAEFTAALLHHPRANQVVLVSSAIHLRRSELYFAHFGVSATPVRADYLRAMLSPLPLSYNFMAADVALHEYIGIARYHLYSALGLNPSRQQPGDA
ncbi:YdcF family protein [Pseudomonas sp.]|uniref:YdcF family protein n=1 Tax=Pseudomonas sp. TaxID=306 RepID=UPI0025896E3A|nr:YdcF family protein [Pseudomonas sp.]